MMNEKFLSQEFLLCRRAVTMLTILACVANWQPVNGQSRRDVPSFSARATTIYRGKQVRSPDEKAIVYLEPFRTQLRDSPNNSPAQLMVETNGKRLAASIAFVLDAEIIWSPDSNAFSLTGSLQGANGQYRTDVFVIPADKLVPLHLTDVIEKQFGNPVRCGWPEPPNVAAIKWLVPSRRLLVASEIIHHSNCDSFGTFKAYAIDMGQEPRITKEYDQLQVKRLFREDLGGELLQADDNCIRDPKSCRIASNWKPTT